MPKNLLLILFPPLAVCRYGCANCCVLPITGFWVGGLLLLYYFISHAQQSHNELLSYGSLAGGIGLLSLAAIWGQNTIARNKKGRCDHRKPRSKRLCQVIPRANENDPLDEIEKAKKL